MSIRHETITVQGTVVYCDKCGKEGPGTAYDNVDDTLECARMDGWTQTDDEKDLCQECSKKPKKPRRR